MNRLFRNFTQIKKQLLKKVNLLNTYNIFIWAIICLGMVLRLAQYLFNRSLWLDEAKPALYIINNSFSELLQPSQLKWRSPAPIGFLMFEKLLIQLFGSSEYILRLFPFLCGVISLFLFYNVSKHYIKRKAILIALLLFAISGNLIYYSSEFKQYSSDVAIALLLYLVAIYIQSKRLITLKIILFGAIGAIAIWFSHPAVFILAGIGLSLTLLCLSKKEWLKIGKLSIIYLIWLLSFSGFYFFSLKNLISEKSSLYIWSGSFIPFPPDIEWFSVKLSSFLKMPMGLSSFPGIVTLTFIVGCISIFLKKKEEFFGLISPIFFTLLASTLHKYPIRERLLLFMNPIILLLIAEGVERIRINASNNFIIIVIILIGLLIFNPLLNASYRFVKPYTKEEIKPVLKYIKEYKHNEDIIYLHWSSQFAFKYYSESYGFNNSEFIVGIFSMNNPENYINELDRLHGNKRVWILFTSVFMGAVNEKEFLLNHLNSIGKKVDSFKTTGASVYLYNLSGKNN